MKRYCLISLFIVSLSSCYAPAPMPVGPVPPPGVMVPPGVAYVAPTYPMPAPGYNWNYHSNYGWGWYHPNHGWHGGWR
jgi:hypothetical protein